MNGPVPFSEPFVLQVILDKARVASKMNGEVMTTKTMEELNTIHHGDCVAGMESLPAESVDLAFADPPFNIGYEYDVYNDQQEREHYLEWCREWISGVHRTLKPDGTFWLAIGDEYAAELKLLSQEVGFHCRSWVIWYYTFGVNCAYKFSRSHAHLFHFVKDEQAHTFRHEALENRIPSARQLVYNDKRANPKGRLPDDTWIIRPKQVAGEITADDGPWDPSKTALPEDLDQTWTLRPQDIEQCFSAGEDTWYFPRVAGTFKERAGFHGCQMPEQLLGRIVRSCSEEGELVMDPFSGSATTLVVSKKLNRKYVGFELSEDYAEYGTQRLKSVSIGDRLEGSAEPTMSAPKSGEDRNQTTVKSKAKTKGKRKPIVDFFAKEQEAGEAQRAMTLTGIMEAFRSSYDGYSVDRVVADPELNQSFADVCTRLGLVGDRRTWNLMLFQLRKSGQLTPFPATKRSSMDFEACDSWAFASEIALQTMLNDELAVSLDEILCDPFLAAEFDQRSQSYAPEVSPLESRLVALHIRKQAHTARTQSKLLTIPKRLGKRVPLDELVQSEHPTTPGVYLVRCGRNRNLYAGETMNLKQRFSTQFASELQPFWDGFDSAISVQFLQLDMPRSTLAWQSCFATQFQPEWNYRDLICE